MRKAWQHSGPVVAPLSGVRWSLMFVSFVVKHRQRKRLLNELRVRDNFNTGPFNVFLSVKDGYALSFWGSMVAGLITTCASLPVDIAKTRTQNMRVINGVPEYKGMVDCLVKTTRNEGVMALWKGWTPYYARTGPLVVVTLMLMDTFMSAYKSMA